MIASDDDTEILKRACYSAYNDAVRVAYKTLSNAITEYFTEHREFYGNELLNVPSNFKPLRDYERMLKIEKLTLRLALKTADLNEHEVPQREKLAIDSKPVASH
jgi:hypothetical protein